MNPRRTSRSADDAKEDAIAQEELEATLLEAEKRATANYNGSGAEHADAGDNDAAAWLRSGDAARALGALPSRRHACAGAGAPQIVREGRRLVADPAPRPHGEARRRARACEGLLRLRPRSRGPSPRNRAPKCDRDATHYHVA